MNTHIYALLNPVVYQQPMHDVTPDAAMDVLKEYMYTVEYKAMKEKEAESESLKTSKMIPQNLDSGPSNQCCLIDIPGSKSDSHEPAGDPPKPINIPIANMMRQSMDPNPKYEHKNEQKYEKTSEKRLYTGSSEQSMFWSVFIAVKGYGEYIREQRRAANVWIEERMRIVDSLKKAPRQMKESNHKLSLEKIQALFSGMMTSRQDKEEDGILYAAYYKIPIVILYDKTAVIFDTESARYASTDPKDPVIYLRAKGTARVDRNGRRQIEYSLIDVTKLDGVRESILSGDIFVVDNLGNGLKGISTYKTEELLNKLDKMVGERAPGRLAKPELYAELAKRVAMDRFII
jgi:hypothetical protein